MYFVSAASFVYREHPAASAHAHAQTVTTLQIAAAQLHHPLLAPVALNFKSGLGPDQVAVLAVILNPKLRAHRDRRGVAAAQLVQAGILPNPQIGYTHDFVTGGNTAGTVSAYGFSGSWDISALITHSAKVEAARANEQAINLDIAWTGMANRDGSKNGPLSGDSSRRGTEPRQPKSLGTSSTPSTPCKRP